MSWYYGTYACGHEGRTNIIGPVKNRQWIADRHFEKLCEECWEQKKIEDRQKENEEAAKKAEEMELPMLSGSEKQIAWANTLRQKLVDLWDKKIIELNNKLNSDTYSEDQKVKINKFLNDEVMVIFQYIFSNKTTAKWYIDNRHRKIDDIAEEIRKEIANVVIDTTEEAKQVFEESIIYPAGTEENEIAKIECAEKTIKVKFEKNEQFIKIVRSLDYSWSREEQVWKRELNNFAGDIIDRVAELGNKLLNAGFPIRILEAEARNKAINGDYEPECKRWIFYHSNDYFKINWYDGTDLYHEARSLPKSEWKKPVVLVKSIYFAEVKEFAELYEFKFSDKALNLYEKVKTAREQAPVVVPIKVKKSIPKDGLKEILESGDDIIDDLRD